MTQYSAVFGASLILNVIITFRASGLWSKYAHIFPCFVSFPTTTANEATTTTSSSSKEQKGHDQEDPLLGGSNNQNQQQQKNQKMIHRDLLKRYLCVYLLATLSDWLQGPYVYALYDSYGYSQHYIAVLFVAGFGSSMVFGSFVGGMADWCGRRKFVVLFAAIYAGSCLTKHFKDFSILMLGRLLGGVATSLLYSVFDAWLIRSHSDAKLDKSYLSTSFSSAAYGNSIIAIIAGLIANRVASSTSLAPLFSAPGVQQNDNSGAIAYVGGFINPFDVAFLALCLCGVLASLLWEENYGEQHCSDSDSDCGRGVAKSPKWYDGLKNAFTVTMRNRDVLLCGIISSLFEGSMYVFVFMWTPALTALTEKEDGKEVPLPFGLIFSTFMVCCMAGSSLFSIALERVKVEALAVSIFGLAAFAMGVITVSRSDTPMFLAMNLFEICVGMYFPTMGTMKSGIVPEDKRAAIYNLYRIPLNFIVLFSLLTHLTPKQSFTLCATMLAVATVLQMQLMKRRLSMSSLSELQEKGMTQMSSMESAVPSSVSKKGNEGPLAGVDS